MEHPRPTREARQHELAGVLAEVVVCRRCPRLVTWREWTADHPPARFAGDAYWRRPVPGMGDPDARVLILGLAPAAHGGNRTGRIFTGDRSGDFLFAALHATGFANQPRSASVTDGLLLRDVYIAAVNRCAPPNNHPTPDERENCLPYLVRELAILSEVRVILALGAYAWGGVLRALALAGHAVPRPRPAFAHGAEATIGRYTLLGCFHPSQQNTFTGKLTAAMLEAVLGRAAEIARIADPGE